MRQTYYRVCELCGAHLDPSEKCDCQDQKGVSKCNQHFIRNISSPQSGKNVMKDLCTVCGSCHKKLHNYYDRERGD